MSRRTKPTVEATWPNAVRLYHKMLHFYYGLGDRPRAIPYALRLIRVLDKLDPQAETLPGNDYRSIIAELDDDLPEAIRYRHREIDLFDELIEKGLLETAKLDWSDYTDRLDLLACLYMDIGDWTKATETIRKSERLCKEHHLRFEGAEIKQDIENKRKRERKAVKTRPIKYPSMD